MSTPDEKAGDQPADESPEAQETDKVEDSDSDEPEANPGAQESSPESVPAPAPGAPSARRRRSRSSKREEREKAAVRRLRRSLGIGLRSNRYRVFLGKGAIPPVIESWSFVAALKQKDRVWFRVMEGDEDQADLNEVLGEIGLGSIQLRDDGRAALRIDFSLDEAGVLEVRLADQEGGAEAMVRFAPRQFSTSSGAEMDLSDVPVGELSRKIDLLEQQMNLLRGEISVRKDRE